jgi:hypothetical protein
MKKHLLLVSLLGFCQLSADQALRISHISFEPTETDKMTLYDEQGGNYPFTTHKFGTIIKAVQDYGQSKPKTISIQPAPAEFPEKFIISQQGNDIYFQPVGAMSYKIDKSMALNTCRNLINCGDYLQSGIYSNWG